MTRRLLSRRQVFFALAAGGVAAGKWLHADTEAATTDDKIDLAKVPAKVKEAASKALPKAKWTGASKSEEDGKVTYELEGEDAAKHYVWVELTADAKVNEVGSEIAFGAVPQPRNGGAQEEVPSIRCRIDLRGAP